jgi:cyclopropane fatty-acyl-phospholipid synthase-like methyltransferase
MTERKQGMKNYSSEWIYKLENFNHWNYYWYQVKMVLPHISKQDKILEIGVGTKFLSNYLKSKGYHITTIDIDPEKKADITADIVTYDFNESFDHVFAFEVFEHIPYQDVENIFLKIHAVCGNHLFFSIPRNEKVWLNLLLEFPGNKKLQFKIATKRRKIISKHHYWEVDYKAYTLKRIKGLIAEKGFELVSQEKFSSLYFFTLKKLSFA